jgi:superfamily II DNA or RNA helicase
MSDYSSFIESKAVSDDATGLTSVPELNDLLFDFQRDIVAWALRRGRAAIFADCGMGKTAMQLEWAKHAPGRTLVLAPLAVSKQTVAEGQKFGIDVECIRSGAGAGDICITNYEMIHAIDAGAFDAVVLDESSILKDYTGKTRNYIIDTFFDTPFRLACTATPAPNDYMELGNHAEFVGAMSRTEMLSMFFVHDGGETQKWRLKGHAEDVFWKWMCSWAVMIRRPSDLGYDDGAFVLPELRMHMHDVETSATGGCLFQMEARTLSERQAARRDTVVDRAKVAADIVLNHDGPTLVWCNLNSEAAAITSMIDGAVNVQGSDDRDTKESRMLAFSDGNIRVMVTKPKIAGHGMNWQHCCNVVFLGLSDSWEQYYQAVRRCWRFGQNNPVDVHIVTADIEGDVVRNIQRKEQDAVALAERMVENMHEINSTDIRGTTKSVTEYRERTFAGDRWELMHGDCVERIAGIENDSIGYSIFSPPFASLYTYSNSPRDMGNCGNHSEFYDHFMYLAHELFRVVAPGRLLSFHCMNLPTSKAHDGYIGIRDFRGEMVRLFESVGFIFHSEVCIWKDPVTAMQRTKAIGLLHKQLCKDSAMSRQAIPDYLVTMRKPGQNARPIQGGLSEWAGEGELPSSGKNPSIDIWQRYASPVWMDINPSRTLQRQSARAEKDERHICPLQLDVIERALQLWSLPDDIVLSPFAGIGSEGHCALLMGRRYVGIELKDSYVEQARKNLDAANANAGDLFSTAQG